MGFEFFEKMPVPPQQFHHTLKLLHEKFKSEVAGGANLK